MQNESGQLKAEETSKHTIVLGGETLTVIPGEEYVNKIDIETLSQTLPLKYQAKELLAKTINSVRSYLAEPMIFDSFGIDHNRRTDWRRSLGTEDRQFYEANKLRINQIADLFLKFDTLVHESTDYEVIIAIERTMNYIRKMFPEGGKESRFVTMSPADKEQWIKTFSEKLRLLLNRLSQYSLRLSTETNKNRRS